MRWPLHGVFGLFFFKSHFLTRAPQVCLGAQAGAAAVAGACLVGRAGGAEEVRRSSISMQGRWAGRSRGTACAQREPETFKGSPGHERRAKAKNCSSFSPADLPDSTAALKNSAHLPAAVRPRCPEVPLVRGTKSLPMYLSTSTAPAGWPLAGGEPHTPAFFWPGPARCCEFFNSPGFQQFLQGGTYSPTPPLHPCQGCQCCMQCDRSRCLRGLDLLTWHIPQSSAWNGHLSWFNPSQQPSTTQPLPHSLSVPPRCRWDREENRERRQNS